MYPGLHSLTSPDRPALVMSGSQRTMTYLELERESAQLARYLHEQGLRRGDGIVLITPNHPQCFITYWAALRSGLYITALNFHLTPHEALAVLRNCQPKAVIVSGACAELAEKIVPAVDGLTVRLCFDGEVAECRPYDEALADTSTEPMADQPRGQDMLYSSGTTGGIPKGIRPPLPDRQVGDPGDPLVATFGARYRFDADTVYLSPGPLYHGGPLRFAIMVQMFGGTVIVLERFDAEAALAAIEKHLCTHSQWVPTMFVRMLRLPFEVRNSYDVSSMQYAIHASAPCPVEVKKEMIAWWGSVLEEYYASQESAGITIISSEEWMEHPGSVGRAALGELKICDVMGNVLGPGETGQIYFARDEIPFVYHREPDATRASQHPEHPEWSSPGDIGHLDDDGYLYLTDRVAFMIISGGVNIYPQEIENELALHPAVEDVAVIGTPDDDLGELVTAVVQVAPGYTADDSLADQIIAHLSDRLARYKVPRKVDFIDRLPRTPTGKLAKTNLIAQYRARSLETSN